jgi:hypothetical protein
MSIIGESFAMLGQSKWLKLKQLVLNEENLHTKWLSSPEIALKNRIDKFVALISEVIDNRVEEAKKRQNL